METGNKTTGVRVRIVLTPDVALGPGKADLLEGIAESGSIAAAGRRMKMSYKRAWMLVEEMNRVFREPLVLSARGGSKGGSAQLTPTGQTVLENYRRLQDRVAEAGQGEIGAIRALIGDMSNGK